MNPSTTFLGLEVIGTVAGKKKIRPLKQEEIPSPGSQKLCSWKIREVIFSEKPEGRKCRCKATLGVKSL